MARPSNRERILSAGMRVVMELGFMGATVRDIVLAAGVPQGSFTNHFASKEAFGLELLERYVAEIEALLEATVRDPDMAPLDAIAAYIAANRARLEQDHLAGCLSGNLSIEAAQHSNAMRQRLIRMFADVEQAIAACLRRAQAEGALAAQRDPVRLAQAMVGGLQGAMLLARLHRDSTPVAQFQQTALELMQSPLPPSYPPHPYKERNGLA